MFGHRVCPSLVLWALMAVLPGPLAARAEAPTELPEVEAEGHAERASEATLANPTSSTTELSARPGEGRTTADQVAQAPGVIVRDLGLNQVATLSIRGSSASQVAVELDGIPLNPLAGGGADLSTLPAPFFDRTTVVRGASGSLYGSGAMGGALLLETLRPRPGETRTFGAFTVGSFETLSLSLGSAFDLGGGHSGLVSLFGESTQGDYPFQTSLTPNVPGAPMTERTRRNNDGLRFAGLAKVSLHLPARLDLLVEADGGGAR